VSPISWEEIIAFLKAFGPVKGLFLLFFIAAHWYVRKLYKQNIDFKQQEIDRIADDHKALREENKELRAEMREMHKLQAHTPKQDNSK